MNTLRFISLALALLTLRPILQAQEARQSNVHIGLVYPISTHGAQALEYSNRFSLHGIAGVSRAETGVALAGLALIVKDSSTGVDASGFANIISGNARGVQLAGFLNIVVGRANGWQAAGFMNLDSSFRGCSLAGFGNLTVDAAGVQVAGFINRASDVRFQAAGFINVAKKVKGVQVAGLINIADSCEYPIGLINFIRHGEKSIGISTDETLTTLLSYRSGSRKLYGIVGVGYNGKSGKGLYAWEAGLGAHFRLSPAFRINTELATIGLSDFMNGCSFRQTLRILPALRLGQHVEIFAGPSFNHTDFKDGEGDGLITHYVWSRRESDGRLQGLYFGVTGGINIIL